MRDFPLDPDIDEKVVKEFGQAMVAYSALDYELKMYVKSLLGVGFEKALAVTAQQHTPGLCHMAFSLFKLRVSDGGAIKEFDKMLSKAFAFNDERNELVHSFWTKDPDSGEVVRIRPTAKKNEGLKQGGKKVIAKELQSFRRRVSDLAHRMDEHRMRELPKLLAAGDKPG